MTRLIITHDDTVSSNDAIRAVARVIATGRTPGDPYPYRSVVTIAGREVHVIAVRRDRSDSFAVAARDGVN